MPEAATSLDWHHAKEILNAAFLNYKTNQKSEEKRRCSVNIRLIYNGTKEDRNITRGKLQEEMLTRFPKCQIWMAKLQNAANS
eukprot:1344098-Ditylum_brightwellii.AAC.1